ncbi:MAG TPA: ABC-F family ATP-binding cassette domain-containing protein [Sporolactobacillaceae bacterium]|nr:ABC-F family ATP-binding cassette domain-containing protein [Sporolactobacillaceae bacterium]
MSILLVENLYKTYGEKTLFDHISFSISEKERVGLIGVNGTGKSSLLKVLAGVDFAEMGDIIHANQFRIEYLPQSPELDGEQTVLDQIFNGHTPLMNVLRDYEMTLAELEEHPEDQTIQKRLFSLQQKMDDQNAWEASTLAKTILTKLGITHFTKKIKELSGGQKKRVALAKALIQPADLLLLDEPTNHLDNETIEWLETNLATYPGALMIVTHDRYFLNRVTNRIFELDKGKLYRYEGNYEVYLERKAEREELELVSEDKRQNLLRRELAWLKRGAKARTTKQKARIQRAEELQEQKGPDKTSDVDMAIGSTRLGKKVLEIEDVTKFFDGKPLIDHFSYLVTPGDRIGIIGPNGTGKTTLLNMLAGRINPDSGTIETGQTVNIGYYTQENVEMNGELRVIEYIKEGAEAIKTIDGHWITAEQMLERFLFARDVQWTYIHRLSGGEKRRLYLLRTLMTEPNVLLLDEPTNDLDVQTLTILESYLDQFPGVVITVSHDRYFLDRVVDHLIAFEGEGNIRHFLGNYTEYLEMRQNEIKQEEKKAASSKPEPRKERPKKLSYKDQKEWDGIEDRIAGLEERIASVQKEIEKAASDLGRVTELYAEQQKLETELEAAMTRWEELSLLIEEIENQ